MTVKSCETRSLFIKNKIKIVPETIPQKVNILQ